MLLAIKLYTKQPINKVPQLNFGHIIGNGNERNVLYKRIDDLLASLTGVRPTAGQGFLNHFCLATSPSRGGSLPSLAPMLFEVARPGVRLGGF